ncbi:MAG: ArsR/SmtB family transcription factor [Clostridium sp.]|uniref:ArsR/SmtB family transcription factor n=1 Tax=Clostridium sp. TaxID=1506 RepID=UPI003F2B0E58
MDKYEFNSSIFKALSEPKRLKIIDLLSCGEKCACELLEFFDFAQPTLSHHMKVLIDCGLVDVKKDGKWNYYKLNNKNANKSVLYYLELVTDTETCICKKNN